MALLRCPRLIMLICLALCSGYCSARQARLDNHKLDDTQQLGGELAPRSSPDGTHSITPSDVSSSLVREGPGYYGGPVGSCGCPQGPVLGPICPPGEGPANPCLPICPLHGKNPSSCQPPYGCGNPLPVTGPGIGCQPTYGTCPHPVGVPGCGCQPIHGICPPPVGLPGCGCASPEGGYLPPKESLQQLHEMQNIEPMGWTNIAPSSTHGLQDSEPRASHKRQDSDPMASMDSPAGLNHEKHDKEAKAMTEYPPASSNHEEQDNKPRD